MGRAPARDVRHLRWRRWMRLALPAMAALYWLGSAHGALLPPNVSHRGAVERVAVNDNRVAAGTLQNGVLTVRLDARTGEWRPDGETDPAIVIRAFAEEGKALQIPAPLIRVPRGTEIRAFVRNSL